MNHYKKIHLLLLAVACICAACNKDWTEPKAKQITDVGLDLNPQLTKSDAYYAELRAYKKSPHQYSFGWFGNWSGKGATLSNSLAGLPDSLDMISLWNGFKWMQPTPEQAEDQRFVQKVKGTKLLGCMIMTNVGAGCTPAPWNRTLDSVKLYWGYSDTDSLRQDSSAVRYANALCDSIDKVGLDGFDLDYEPTVDGVKNMADNYRFCTAFVRAMAKRLGPLSGTNKIFTIDGEVSVLTGVADCFDFFISQAYGTTAPSSIDNRATSFVNKYISQFPPEYLLRRFIVAENFESYASTGGVAYTDRDGTKMQSLEGMARWKPLYNGKLYEKGGVGTYHIEYEYTVGGKTGTYPYSRNAIRIMNPAVN